MGADWRKPDNAIASITNTKVLAMAKANPEKYSICGHYVRLRQRPTPRQYTKEEKAKIVAFAALTTDKTQRYTARIFGISQRTVSEWTRGINISKESLVMAHDFKERIKAKLEDIVELALDTMPEKADKASFWDLARTAGLAFDKIQLMEGKPTSITGNELPSNERARLIFALMDKAKQAQLEAQVIDVIPVEDSKSALEVVNDDEWNTI